MRFSRLVRAARFSGADCVPAASVRFFGGGDPRVGAESHGAPIRFLGSALTCNLIHNVIGDACALVRRAAFEAVGGFSEDYGLALEDMEFFHRLVRAGFRTEPLPDPAYFYRIQPGSMIGAMKNERRLEEASRARVLAAHVRELPAEERAFASYVVGRIVHASDAARVARGITWILARIWRWVHAPGTGRAARGTTWMLIRIWRRTRRPARPLDTTAVTGMRVLVTGGCGFVGANLVRVLAEGGLARSIRVVDDESNGRRDAIARYGVEFVQGDVRDAALLRRSMEHVDTVVHLAADTRVMDSIEDPAKNFDVNVVGTFRLLAAMREAGVPRLVNASTGGAILGRSAAARARRDGPPPDLALRRGQGERGSVVLRLRGQLRDRFGLASLLETSTAPCPSTRAASSPRSCAGSCAAHRSSSTATAARSATSSTWTICAKGSWPR